MCGRYFLKTPLQDIAALFGVPLEGRLEPRYNIAPSQPILALRKNEREEEELSVLQWGLVPAWRKEAPEKPMINARVETVLDKPSFRAAYRHRRCLIPASGFFEWQDGPAPKQPWLIRVKDTSAIAFAGIWERWAGPGGDNMLEGAAILTKPANAAITHIHHRMPVILTPNEFPLWMGDQMPDPEMIFHLAGYPNNAFETIPVSRHVSNARNDDARCVEPVALRKTEPDVPEQPSLF